MENNNIDLSENKITSDKNKKNKKKIIWIILLVLIIILIPFCWYENNHLVITKLAVANLKIPDAFDGYKIVQISDLHNASFGKNNVRLIEKIKAEAPDIIVLTGDIVDSNHTKIDVSLDFCKEIVNICPVYYITGNHEYWLSAEDQERAFSTMSEYGVNILDNDSILLENKDDSVLLIGLDDKHLSDMTLEGLIDNDYYNIVLAHEPQYIYRYASANADLVLSGHAHGGQFILPFIGPVVAPEQGLFPKYTEGEYVDGNTTMIVSRGLGNSVIPVRLFNDPEIVVVELSHE